MAICQQHQHLLKYVKLGIVCVYSGEDARNALAYLPYLAACLIAVARFFRYIGLCKPIHVCIFVERGYTMLFSSPDPRVTKPLTGGNQSPDTSVKLPAATSTAPLFSQNTSVKVPIVIPATNKRVQTDPLLVTNPHSRRIMPPAVLIIGMLIIMPAFLFVIPLVNRHHTSTIAQDIGSLFSNSQACAINTFQQAVSPSANMISSSDGSAASSRGTDIWSSSAAYITASGIHGTGQMQRPIRGAVITQVFGHMEYQLWCGCWRPHTAIALAAPYGTPIMAADTGQGI